MVDFDLETLRRLYRALPVGREAAAPELAAAAGLAPARVAEAVAALAARGAAVAAAAAGFRRVLPPPLDAAAIRAAGHEPDREVVVFDELETTMAPAADMARRGAAHGAAALAEKQTAGRGRRGRSWSSPPRLGLYMSVVLGRERMPEDISPLALLLGVAAAAAVSAATAVDVRLKWPNDLLAGDAKVGGVIADAPDSGAAVIAGFGVNVFHCPFDFPDDLPSAVSSLAMAGAAKLDRNVLAGAVLRHLDRWFQTWREGGPAPLIRAWREANVTLGRRVRVADADVEGYAADVGDDGALLVEDDAGAVHRFYAADVVHLR